MGTPWERDVGCAVFRGISMGTILLIVPIEIPWERQVGCALSHGISMGTIPGDRSHGNAMGTRGRRPASHGNSMGMYGRLCRFPWDFHGNDAW